VGLERSAKTTHTTQQQARYTTNASHQSSWSSTNSYDTRTSFFPSSVRSLDNSRLLTIPKACLTTSVTRAEWDTANFHSGFWSRCKSMHEKEQTPCRAGLSNRHVVAIVVTTNNLRLPSLRSNKSAAGYAWATPSGLGAPNSRPHNKTELLGGFHNWRRSSASSAGRISSRLMSPRLFDDHTYLRSTCRLTLLGAPQCVAGVQPC
jgi:hypothetical protein